MKTVEIAIKVDDPQVKEQVIAQLSAIGFDAFEERAEELAAFIGADSYDDATVQKLLSVYRLAFNKTVIREQNWNAVWESSFEPVVINNFCAIRAGFHSPMDGVQHEIIITPKMSFGTGHHATTYMMVSEMSKVDFKDKSVADFGTGTGVLAILAEKMGARYIWAIDNDDWSIDNATENIQKNGCSNIVVAKKEYFAGDEKFDVVLANINKHVILANLDALVAGCRVPGTLLLSGLLKEDEKEIVKAVDEKGCVRKSTIERNNWVCLRLHIK